MNGLETLWGGVVIAVGNQKGGVGKTTTAVHIARGLANRGHKTLLWDLDPSAGATKHFAIVPDAYPGTLELLLGEVSSCEALVTPEDGDPWLPERLDFVPSRRELETIDNELSARCRFWNPLDVLETPLREYRNQYDIIVLDTPPSTVLSPALSAYASSDWFLLAAMPDPLSVAGLADASHDIESVRKRANPHLRLLGVVLNAVDMRTRLARELTAYVDARYSTPCGESLRFAPTIGRSTVVPTAQKLGKTVPDAFPEHPVARQFDELAVAIETRLVLAQHGLSESDEDNPNGEAA